MKKILLTLIFVSLLAADSQGLPSFRTGAEPWAQPSQKEEPVAQREGIYREYFDNGVLKRETVFRHGQVHGRCRTFYEGGGLRKQANYEEGILDGKAFELYENGQYKVESNYSDGKADGMSKIYYANGDLYRLLVFKRGQLVKSYTLDLDGRTVTK